jgi:hypothetical protein
MSDYEEIPVNNRTDEERCTYFIKCFISEGTEKNCPCVDDLICFLLENPCTSSIIQYPNGAIIGPYAFTFYKVTRDWYIDADGILDPDDDRLQVPNKLPDGIQINGTIKCRGYMIVQYMTLRYRPIDDFRKLDLILCASNSNVSELKNIGYDEFCYNDSRTFNNRSYNVIDICRDSRECISAYRIRDDYFDCVDGNDEWRGGQVHTLFPNACSNIQHHRFRCSNEQPTCLTVNKLGDQLFACANYHDEQWAETNIQLSNRICDKREKYDCDFIRQYIQISAKINANNTFDSQLQLLKISFRDFCDTFADWKSRKDEDIVMCKSWWKSGAYLGVQSWGGRKSLAINFFLKRGGSVMFSSK